MLKAAGCVPERPGGEHDLVLLATGVGVGPFYALAAHLLRIGYRRRISLYWGLRLPDDICLTAELDRLARNHTNFGYAISLSQPPPDWDGLRGPKPWLACVGGSPSRSRPCSPAWLGAGSCSRATGP